ncbi:superoxide dismutase [Urbifossiella limnaea]|uniref:Superoxide dismutase n=1 Tax=Urbifossiella limnaea TaxID=2528023 RepID=A0A517XP71_9BACT|nr:superoxide dismutase [Urbifossiella limnaea]QDU19298.1 Superoxide dismutase [Mn] [Urbifossiella limnaea]
MLTRRDLFKSATAGAAGLAFPGLAAAQPKGPFVLAPLPYPATDLEPVIDAETMTIHHDRHHQAYVTNLNAALAGAPDWAARPIEDIVRNIATVPEAVRTAVRNNGGGHLNHTWFWRMMAKPGTGGAPSAELSAAIDASFGSMDGFKKAFTARALGQFGSGWAWLVVGGADGKPLGVSSTPNQDSPLMEGKHTLLGVDVWEHAYYLKYRNVRAKYVEAWFQVVNWNHVNEQYTRRPKA